MNIIEKSRTFSLKKAGFINIAVGSINILLHFAVIIEFLPYTWVNGGRSANIEIARQISMQSIILTCAGIATRILACGLVPIKFGKKAGIAISILFCVMLPMDLLSIIMQFIGTPFEKCVTSILTIIIFVTDFRIAVEKRWES